MPIEFWICAAAGTIAIMAWPSEYKRHQRKLAEERRLQMKRVAQATACAAQMGKSMGITVQEAVEGMARLATAIGARSISVDELRHQIDRKTSTNR